MRRILLAALVVALLAPALVRAAPPAFTLSESVSAASMERGGSAQTIVYLNASAPATFQFSVQDAAGLDVTLSVTSGNAIPGTPSPTTVTARSLNGSFGAHVVRIAARDTTNQLSPSDPASVDFTVTIVDPVTPPILTPRSIDLEVAGGSEGIATFTVHNPDNASRTYNVTIAVPSDWAIHSGPSTVTVSANTTSAFFFTAYANTTTRNGSGTLTVGASTVGLTLRVKAPPSQSHDPVPSPSPTPSPPTPTPEPTPTTKPTTPTPTPTPDPSPTPSTTTDPTPPSQPTVAPPPPSPSPATVRLTLLVEPAIVAIAPGGRANATIVVSSSADVTLTLHLQLPSGFTSDIGTAPVTVAANVDAMIVVQLHEVAGAPPNSAFDALVVAEGADVPPSAFRIVVQLPPTGTPAAVVESGLGTPSAQVVVGAAVVGGVSVAAFATRRKWLVGLALLYTRLKPQALLEQPQRARIMETLQATPGASFGELQRALDLANGALRHHLDLLEKTGTVVSIAHGQQRRFYLAGLPRAPLAPRLPERAIELVRARGPMTQTQLAQELGVSRQALHYHVQRLAKEGKLRTRVVGRELVIEAAPPATA